jgi:hypothetical protein
MQEKETQMNLTYEIKGYTPRLTRVRGEDFGDYAQNVDYDEWIYCRGDGEQVVRIFFVKNDDFPKSFLKGAQMYGFLPSHQYPYAIDLLRNEGPVYAYIESSEGHFELKTGPEAVSEGEHS